MIRQLYSKVNAALHNNGVGRFSSVLKRNKCLGNSGEGEKCFILATGPSIKTQDLSGLEGQFCISVSNFFVHPIFHRIKPKYHIFAGSHPPITEQQTVDWWQDASNHFSGEPLNVFLHARNKYIKDRHALFDKQQVYYYLDGGKYPVDFTKPLPEIKTVVHIAIYLAMYLGFRKIYLLGCDHSWLLHHGVSQHFYEEKEHSFTRNNYSEWSEIKDIGYEFESHANLWKIYREIRSEAQKSKCEIYNATPQSLLDVFPRVNLSEIIN